MIRDAGKLALISSRRKVFLLSVAILTAVSLLGGRVCAAQAQTADTTARAKAHYQNAIAAIAKSDWQTAKSELLQAEKLAPQNALVHYDLALAYSHTGQLKSAQAELNKATQLGLPAEQKQAAVALKQKLARAPSGSGSKEKGTPARHSPQDSSVHALNTLIKNELGVTRADYRPYEFTFETSTGKLWWSRLSDSYCKYNVALSQAGARLSELDADSISTGTNKDGISELVLSCKNGAACFEDWASPACTSIDNFKHTWNDSVDVLDKTFTNAGVESEMRFMGRLTGLEILTTGDPDGSRKAIELLKQLISLAPPPSEAYVAEASRRSAEQKAEDEKKQAENSAFYSALEGQWRYTDGLATTWTLSIRVDSGKMAGSIVHAYHRDAKYHEGRCTTQDPPSFCSAVNPENRADVCLPKTTCTQSRTTPGKDWTVYWALEGSAKKDAGVRISGQYQRCVGDCDAVSNPHEMDIGDQGMELRESKLYWAGKQFTHQ
jgi:tetratricopeptide (TPR) repeat protein